MRDVNEQPADDGHAPDQWDWHIKTIDSIIDRWRAGSLNTAGKRRAIADENQRYYGSTAPAWMTRTGRQHDGRRR